MDNFLKMFGEKFDEMRKLLDKQSLDKIGMN